MMYSSVCMYSWRPEQVPLRISVSVRLRKERKPKELKQTQLYLPGSYLALV